MKPFYLLAIVWLLGGLPVVAQTEVLTVEQCRALALENSPLQRKKLYAESISALQIRNLQSNSLPKIQVGAQASWQSDVFGLPFSLPGSDIPQVPQDQYKLSLDVNQRIWDGGSDRHLRQQRTLERDLAAAQVASRTDSRPSTGEAKKNATRRWRFNLVEPAGIEPASASPPQQVLHAYPVDLI